jgi:ABC-2 type transport system ATP-binding protein
MIAAATHDLRKLYGREKALDGVDLNVPQGSVYLLAGRNGAGKSTLLRLLLNLEQADGGRAEVLGLVPRQAGPAIRARTGYVPEGPEGAYRWMTAGRLFDHLARFYPNWDREYQASLARLFDVRLHRRLGDLSKGQLRAVQIVAALAHRPELLLLDELTDGLDPLMRDEVLGTLAGHLADTGCTAILSTHLVAEVERLADHVGVLRGGRLVAQEPVETVLARLGRYELAAPHGWSPPDALAPSILRKGPALGRSAELVIDAAPDSAAHALAASGAEVRGVSRLPLSEAVALLLRKGETDAR